MPGDIEKDIVYPSMLHRSGDERLVLTFRYEYPPES